MKNKSTLMLVCVLWTSMLWGQAYKFEGGLFLGGANFQGDLVETNIFNVDQTTLGVGLNFKYHLSPIFALRANLLHGKLKGNDDNYDRLKERGFNFRTPLTEFSVQFEWDALGKQRYEEDFKRLVSPYLFAGVGIAFFKPDTNYGDSQSNNFNLEKVEQDQKENYSTTLPVIPMGFGIKVDLKEQWLLAVELGMRKTFTDYLDGVSQSGNPDKDDWYTFYGASVMYRFGAQRIKNEEK